MDDEQKYIEKFLIKSCVMKIQDMVEKVKYRNSPSLIDDSCKLYKNSGEDLKTPFEFLLFLWKMHNCSIKEAKPIS